MLSTLRSDSVTFEYLVVPTASGTMFSIRLVCTLGLPVGLLVVAELPPKLALARGPAGRRDSGPRLGPGPGGTLSLLRPPSVSTP